MPTLREIKGHISSVQSIAKVTRVENTRAFAEKSWEVLNHLASAAEPHVQGNPVFCGYPAVERTGMLLITSNKGMVGAYDHNIIALASEHLMVRDIPAEVVTLGTVGRAAMLRRGYHIHADFSLLDKIIRFQIHQAFLEAATAENASRVIAMRTATKNATDLVDHLKLNYNKVRQQTITAELVDILGGSAALSEN